jgi:hypothetical protein
MRSSATAPCDVTRRRVLRTAATVAGLGAASYLTGTTCFGAENGAAQSLSSPWFDDLERRTFLYFWETTPAATGLTPDRWPSPAPCSIAAVGFALTAYPVGVTRGWITREQAAERVRTTLRWFRNAPQGAGPHGNSGYKGFFYHFLNAETGLREGLTELSPVDTSLFLLGALFCREWFDGSNAVETEIRSLADELYAAVDWEWMRRDGRGIPYAWHPEHGHDPVNWTGYDEGLFIYLLALGSPTHPVPTFCWDEWTRTYETKSGGWGGQHGPAHLQFAPHFGHQYTQVWVDMRGIQDAYMRKRGIDYFENSRRATYAQQAYAIANPGGWKDYGQHVWGLTACDGPAYLKREYQGRLREFYGYTARGIARFDDGTIAPTAAAASLPFAPEIVVPAIETMHARYGDLIYDRYGFLDSFNPSFDFDEKLAFGRHVPGRGWYDTDYIAIDQGPILAMFANHRSEMIWSTMRRADWLRRGLERAGFRGGWLDR